MQIYEYLFVGIIIISILVASSAMIDMLSKPAGDASQKDQLKVTAEKIMTHILLDPGFPFDWGSTQDEPQMFGLAKYGETSREAYILDPDKVQRLNLNTRDFYLPPSKALQLLNLGHDYGFNLEISENLEVTLQKVGNSSEAFTIKVTSYFDQMPLANTQIVAALYDTLAENVSRRGVVGNTTTYDGTCTIDFALPPGSQREVLVVTANYYGTHLSRVFTLGSEVITAFLFGDKIVTSQDYTLYYPDRQLVAREVLVTRQSQSYTVSEFDMGESDFSGSLVIGNDIEPSAVALLASARNEMGQETMLAAYRQLSMNYSSIDFVNARSAAFSYSLERTVLIAGTTYTTTLFIWRMAS